MGRWGRSGWRRARRCGWRTRPRRPGSRPGRARPRPAAGRGAGTTGTGRPGRRSGPARRPPTRRRRSRSGVQAGHPLRAGDPADRPRSQPGPGRRTRRRAWPRPGHAALPARPGPGPPRRAVCPARRPAGPGPFPVVARSCPRARARSRCAPAVLPAGRPGARGGPEPVQPRDRLPGPHAAEVGAEVLHPRSSGPFVDHGQRPRGRLAAEPDVDPVLLATRGPVPARHGRLQQVALQPGRFVHRPAGHRLDPGHLGHHPGQVPPAAQVRPVRPHPRPQGRGPPHVQHPAARVPEPVDARFGRQPRHHRRPPGLRPASRGAAHPPSMRRSRASDDAIRRVIARPLAPLAGLLPGRRRHWRAVRRLGERFLEVGGRLFVAQGPVERGGSAGSQGDISRRRSPLAQASAKAMSWRPTPVPRAGWATMTSSTQATRPLAWKAGWLVASR